MSHQHQHTYRTGSEKRLLYVTVLNFAITFVQIVGGLISNSLSLISDAIHNLGDATSILLAYIAQKIGRKKSSLKKTFGFKRAEILTALFNAVVLIGICLFLLFEAVERFRNPQPIKGLIMFIVATFGLLANLISVLILKFDKKSGLNVRAAYLHLLSDTISSVVVILGGVTIYFFSIYWIDPVITILISLFIIKHAWDIVKKAIDILMQSSPADIDIDMIKQDLEKVPEVSNIHHVHVWNLTENQIHFECHVETEQDIPLSKAGIMHEKIESILREKFGIHHVTIQPEHNLCHEKDIIVEHQPDRS